MINSGSLELERSFAAKVFCLDHDWQPIRCCRLVPFEKADLTLASLGDDANLIGAARVWYHRSAQEEEHGA